MRSAVEVTAAEEVPFVVEDLMSQARSSLDVLGSGSSRDWLNALGRARGQIDAMIIEVARRIADERGPQAAAVVAEVTGVGSASARRTLDAARWTGPGEVLDGLGDRLARGEISREVLDAAVEVAGQVPASCLATAADRQVIADFLDRAVSYGATPRQVRQAGRLLLARVRPEKADGRDTDMVNRRHLTWSTDFSGMLVGRFALDPAAGAQVAAAILAHAAPEPDVVDDAGTVHRDMRTPAQRNADALLTVAEMALGVATARRGERPHIVVQCTPGQVAAAGTFEDAATSADAPEAGGSDLATIAGHGPIPAWLLGRVSCDAVLRRLVVDPGTGDPLDLGRTQRLATRAQRLALSARDGGCVICGVHPDWCDAHHIRHWAAGGATDMANLLLLCPRHHTSVHTGEWDILLDDDPDAPHRIWLVPPRDVDPRRTPRPPVHHAVTRALRDLGTPGDSGPDPGGDPP
jgi:hypothetical protein